MANKNIEKQSLSKKRGRPVDRSIEELIIKKASEMFMKNGYSGTSMDKVAKICKISKITLYSRFKDKDELFKAAIIKKCNEHNKPSSFSQFIEMRVDESLRIIAKNFVTLIFSKEAVQVHRIVETESIRYPKISKIFYDAGPQPLKNAMKELFYEWQKNKKVKIDNIEKAVEHFLSLLKGEAHMKVLLNLPFDKSEIELDKHIDSCINMFIKTYC